MQPTTILTETPATLATTATPLTPPEVGKQTLSVVDNRTGISYEIPIKDGAFKTSEFRQIKVEKDDFGLMGYDPAFLNTASCKSAIETYLETREWPPLVTEALPPAAATRLEPQTPSCPRCGVALAEGEEETICCAGRQLIWTCTSCWKVSEGFAFPFGLCPMCGGELHLTHDNPAAGRDAAEAIRSAYEIELGGVAFYERGAGDSRNPEVAELFRRLADMEREHMGTLARRYHIEEPDAAVPYVCPARIAIYTGLEGRLESPSDLLRLAIHLENRARRFFLETGRRFAPASLEWRLYRELEAEEREHAELLATALQNVEAERPVFV